MDGGFRHQGPEEIHRSGKTRRARRRSYGEVQRILQLLDVAGKPEDKSVRRLSLPRPRRQAETLVGARDRELPDQFPLVARKRLGCRFGSCHEGGSYGEKERTAARPPGRDYQGGIILERFRPSAVTAAAQALGVSRPMLHGILAGRKPRVRHHVPEGRPPVWQPARSRDAMAGRLQPEDGQSTAGKSWFAWRGSCLSSSPKKFGPEPGNACITEHTAVGRNLWRCQTNSGSSFVLRSGASGRCGRLVSAVRSHIEREYSDCWVEGEISNLRIPDSGHLYFTLKEETAQLIVSYDLFLNDTARRFADIVLPGTAWLEELGCKMTHTHLYLMEPALEAPGETRSLYRLVKELAARLNLEGFHPWASEEAMVDAILDHPCTGYATVAALRVEGGIRALNVSHIANPTLDFDTPSRKIEFYSEQAERLGLPALPAHDLPARQQPRTGRRGLPACPHPGANAQPFPRFLQQRARTADAGPTRIRADAVDLCSRCRDTQCRRQCGNSHFQRAW